MSFAKYFTIASHGAFASFFIWRDAFERLCNRGLPGCHVRKLWLRSGFMAGPFRYALIIVCDASSNVDRGLWCCLVMFAPTLDMSCTVPVFDACQPKYSHDVLFFFGSCSSLDLGPHLLAQMKHSSFSWHLAPNCLLIVVLLCQAGHMHDWRLLIGHQKEVCAFVFIGCIFLL